MEGRVRDGPSLMGSERYWGRCVLGAGQARSPDGAINPRALSTKICNQVDVLDRETWQD